MNQIITGPNNFSNPTLMFKGIENTTIPDIQIVSPADFTKFIYTGIKVVIDTPVVRNSRNAIFAVNLDGFIPNDIISTNFFWANTLRSMFPIQVFNEFIGKVTVFQEQIALPIQMLYFSHRFVAGSIGVGVRVTSNTSQSGNLVISQATGVKRDFYGPAEAYSGLRFSNQSYNTSDYTVNNFVIADVSLNRNVSIVTNKKDPLKMMDLPKKIDVLSSGFIGRGSLDAINQRNTFESQYLEDWLLFGLLSNFPNQNADQVTLDFFFDYSRVQFYTPMSPIIPTVPNDPSRQILNFTKSFVGISVVTRDNATWLPGTTLLDEEEVDEKLKSITLAGND